MTEENERKIIRKLEDISSGIGWACLWLFIIMMTVCGIAAGKP